MDQSASEASARIHKYARSREYSYREYEMMSLSEYSDTAKGIYIVRYRLRPISIRLPLSLRGDYLKGSDGSFNFFFRFFFSF